MKLRKMTLGILIICGVALAAVLWTAMLKSNRVLASPPNDQAAALAETVALATILQLARETGARVHLARLSTYEGIAMVRAAKAQGMAVTCDVASTHVHLSENDLFGFDSHLHLVPPLRSLRDRDAIREALRDGSVDALCSDHTPVDEDEKQLPFGESAPGASGVELLLPPTLKWAREMGVPLLQAIDLISWKPAQILGVPGGNLSVVRKIRNWNSNARIVIVTRYASIAPAVAAIKQGANDYIPKRADR